MDSKKINQLATNVAPSIYDLTVVGDATSGELKKITLNQIASLFGSVGGVSSVAMTVPTGLSISGSPITTSGTFALSLTAGYSIPTTAKQTEWDAGYAERLKWDGGATGLVASTARTSLGLVIGTDVLAYRTFGSAANNNTGDFATAAQGTNADTAYSLRITGASLPLSISSNNISITQASTSANGYLSSTDWNTFNGKQAALGFTPYNATNPSGYLSSVSLTTNVTGTLPIANGGTGSTTASAARTALGLAIGSDVLAYRTFGTAANSATTDFYASGNPSGYITGITSLMVTNALGFTPYSAANPSGYTNNTGTVTSVSGTGTVSGLTLTGSFSTSGSLTLGGTLSLTSLNVTGALGFTPYNATNPNNYISGNQTITLSGDVSGSGTTAITTTIGALKVTNAMLAGTINYSKMDGTTVPTWNQNTTGNAATASSVAWTSVTGRPTALSSFTNDLGNYGGWITGITSGNVTTALGYTPYNSSNPSGYISSITSGNVTTALGYTPYNATNPNGYITSAGSISGNAATATVASSLSSMNISQFTNNSGYITGITSGNVTTALGYTPYNSSNPSGYITGITSGNVTTALGYTPANNANTVLLTGTQTIGGYKTFSLASTFEDGFWIKHGTATQAAGYTGIGASTSGLSIGFPAAINYLSFPTTTGYTYTFPAATGTIALTSSLSSYLPLTGGTLTGALITTSIKTDAPSGDVAKVWKLGTAYSGSGITQTHYVNVEVDGVIYALLASNMV